jgi:hypothetical protein
MALPGDGLKPWKVQADDPKAAHHLQHGQQQAQRHMGTPEVAHGR